MEISRTDLNKAIKYLEDAAKIFGAPGNSTLLRNRARLIGILIKKLKHRIPSHQ